MVGSLRLQGPMDDSADETEGPEASDEGQSPEVVVYWRPGCGFCSSLRRQLATAGVPTREVDIWSDSDAAAQVRAVANGNETVPTVAVAGHFLVNPRARTVVALAAEAGIVAALPDEAPTRMGPRPSP